LQIKLTVTIIISLDRRIWQVPLVLLFHLHIHLLHFLYFYFFVFFYFVFFFVFFIFLNVLIVVLLFLLFYLLFYFLVFRFFLLGVIDIGIGSFGWRAVVGTSGRHRGWEPLWGAAVWF
jgi:hypothetical protein